MDTINLYESLKPSRLQMGISALNGYMGDSLQRSNSLLNIKMGFYHQNQRLDLTSAQLEQLSPAPSPKVAIFVHGLSSHEQLWSFPQQTEQPTPRLCYGSLLLNDFAYTPLYLRFNSGLHISDNGQSFSSLMEDFIKAYPVDIEQIVLVGHSLGGLLIRSACHYGKHQQSDWVELVSKVFYLGSPHLGTPWENKTDSLYARLALSDHPIARRISRLYEARSAAIRDLRYPHLIDEDWQHSGEPKATSIPWLNDTIHHFIGATITNNPDHPLSQVVGDGLVPLPSAHGYGELQTLEAEAASNKKYSALLSGINHLRLAHTHQVYKHIKHWMEDNYALSHMHT